MTDKKGTDKHAVDDARANEAGHSASSSTEHEGSIPGSVADKNALADKGTDKGADKGGAGDKTGSGTGAAAETTDRGRDSVVADSGEQQQGKPKQSQRKSKNKDNISDSKGDPTVASGRQQRATSASTNNPTTATTSQSGNEAKNTASKTDVGSKVTATKSSASQAGTAAKRSVARGNGSGGSSGGGSNDDGESNRRGKLAAVIAIIALIIAIIAIICSAWIWQSSMKRMVGVNNHIATLQSDVEADLQNMFKPRLAQIQSRMKHISSTYAQRGKALQQQRKKLAELRKQLDNTRLRMAGMAQRLQGSTRRWRLNQIEHLLITANRRLQLYGSPKQAKAALELASKGIKRINDPRLYEVRQQIIDEIAALEALPSPDIQGVGMTLTAYIKRVRDLPLASDVPENYQPETSASSDNKGGGIDLDSGWHHFVNSVGHALKSMATIRRADGTQKALLPPDQVYFLTQNLMLELRSARLALLVDDSTLYRTSLKSAVKWLKQYYDTDNPGVSAMIDRLGQMQNIKLNWQPPDIRASLRGLRDYMQARSRERRAAVRKAEHKQASATTHKANTGTKQQGSK